MPTVSELQTKISAAATALASGDYAAARTHALVAQALAAGIPDATAGGATATFDRAAIARLIEDIDRAAAAAVGIGTTRVVFA
jgi:hypothetical protein